MLSIDITDKQVKLVRGNLAGSKIRVMETDSRELTLGSVSNGYIADIPMVASEISDIINSKNIKDKEAIVSINSSAIIYKEMDIPKPKKLSNSVAIESMVMSNMGITNEYNISYSIIGETEDENKNPMIRLSVTACPQRLVDGYIRLFTNVGLSLIQINISNNCITRLIKNTPKLVSSMPLLLVQIDNDFLNINLYENGEAAFSRYIKIDKSDYENEADYINQAVYDNIFRMIQFYEQTRNSEVPLKEIMFYGVINDFIALTNAVSSFNVPSHILSLPNNVVTFCDLDFSNFANAIGAFYKTHKDYDHVNLLDAMAVKEKKGMNTFLLKVAAVAIVSAAVVGVGAGVLGGVNAGIKAKTNSVNEEINSTELQTRLSILNQKITILENFQTYRVAVNEAKELFDYKPKATTDVLNKLTEVMPSGMDISGSVQISGYSVSASFTCDNTDSPAEYVQALVEQGYFVNIAYNGYTSTGEGSNKVYKFSLTMLLKGGNAVETK